MVWCPLSTKGLGTLDHKGGGLVGKKFMVGQILEEFFKEEGQTSTMDGKRCSKPFGPNWKLWCIMDSNHNIYVPIVGWR